MNLKRIILCLAVLAAIGGVWLGRTIYRAKKNMVTINVYNAPIADVIKSLARQTRETILAEKDLQTKVTLKVKNVPLEEALEQLGRQAGVNWSKWHAVHDSSRALDKLEKALGERTKIEEVGWTNLAPRDFPGEPSWHAGGPEGASGGEVVVSGRKPVMIKLNSADVKDGNVQAVIEAKLRAAGIDPAVMANSDKSMSQTMDVDVQVGSPDGPGNASGTTGGSQPKIRMITRTKDGGGHVVEEVWSPEHLVMEQKLGIRLGNLSTSDPSEAGARAVAQKVKGDLTTLYVLSSAPGGFPFAGKMMRQFHTGGGEGSGTNASPKNLPPMPDVESMIRRAEAENYTRLTPEQRVQRAREKQAAKTKP